MGWGNGVVCNRNDGRSVPPEPDFVDLGGYWLKCVSCNKEIHVQRCSTFLHRNCWPTVAPGSEEVMNELAGKKMGKREEDIENQISPSKTCRPDMLKKEGAEAPMLAIAIVIDVNCSNEEEQTVASAMVRGWLRLMLVP